jgi:hypothetical protein
VTRRKISIACLALVWVVVSQVMASAAISRYIDGPRNERTVAVEAGIHAWAADTAAHPGVYGVWVKPDGGPAYRVSSASSTALLGSIDLANPTFGDVLVFSSSRSRGGLAFNLRLWDLANREALSVPDGINTPTADERSPSISGDYLLFERQRSSGSDRLILYRFSTQTFTSIIAMAHPRPPGFEGSITGDFMVYDTCSGSSATFVCNVFRRRISTSATVQVPNPGRVNHWPAVTADGTVYYVQSSARSCGRHTKLMKWTGTGTPTTLAALPEAVEAGPTDAYDDGVSTTFYFTRMRCVAGFPSGIYRLPNA